MTTSADQLISRYLDDVLTDAELSELEDRLKASAEVRRQFVQAAFLHDRLHGEFAALTVAEPPIDVTAHHDLLPAARRRSRAWVATAGLAVALLLFVAMWFGVGETRLSAAMELTRIIAAQEAALDRTYHIAVEESTSGAELKQNNPQKSRAPKSRPADRADGPPEANAVEDRRRPPKPPMDDATLHVGRDNRFVLIRHTADGRPFITGSSGQQSWAVSPDGPVRVSDDLTRFNRDLPGHEHGMPLIHIKHGLESLRSAYDVELLPIENVDDDYGDDEPTRLLVAVKKRGVRGPRRVEITYGVRTGLIRQLRFVEMPYGPERLTLRLTLQEERTFDPEFFHHASHHARDRKIVTE